MANAIYRYHGKAGMNSWAKWFVGRTMRQRKNNLISIVGKTGSGKTYSAISICEIMSKLDGIPFTIDHIVFSLLELMELINHGNLKKGSKIVFDEPQISISSREFQSEANKVFNYLLSTFRHRQFSLFFCTPFESLLDRNTRRLFHARFETLSINFNKNVCRIKPRFIEYADFKTEPYRKQMIIQFKDTNGINKQVKLFFWDIPKPSQALIEQYEKKKIEFTTNLNRNITKRLQKFDDAGKSMTSNGIESKPIRKPLTDKQEAVMKAIANVQGDDRLKQSSNLLGICMSSISKHKTLAEKKGYSLAEFVGNGV